MANQDEPDVKSEQKPTDEQGAAMENDGSRNAAEAASSSNPQNPEGLQAELEEARKKAAENWDLFLRTRADADNLRRRSQIDLDNAHKYGIEKLARELLGVVDSLDHGLAAADAANATALKEGMELTHKLLIDTLDKFNIKQINPLGENFDPKCHEALTTQVGKDVEPNKVLTVVQKGFTLHDRLLRPARVIVSKAE